MRKRSLLFALALTLALLLGVQGPHILPSPATLRAAQSPSRPYAPGRVLVGLRFASPSAVIAQLLKSPDVLTAQPLLPGVYALSVPEGREDAVIQALTAHPAVAYAHLDYLVAEPPAQQPAALAAPSPAIPSPENLFKNSRSDVFARTDHLQTGSERALNQVATTCVITDTLHMELPGGVPLPEDTAPSGSADVYAVFDYRDCAGEMVRIQVFAQDLGAPPPAIFEGVDWLKGSGTASIRIPATGYFVAEKGFPAGRYLTLLYTALAETPGSSWVPLHTVAWQVGIRPNDEWYRAASNYQWSLHNTGYWGTPDADIDAPEAWDISTGWDGIVIAIISTGISMERQDLASKIWVNADEIPNNGRDDDQNGYVDDVYGYDFAARDPDPTDHFGYGTFAAGIAAAETNNRVGIAGVSWRARIMPIKVTMTFRMPDGTLYPGGRMTDLIEGLRYAVDNGARVIYSSPLVMTDDPTRVEALREAVQYALTHGALVVVPTGNQGQELCLYPACFEEVLSVGATGPRDELASLSNWGAHVDLVAPGVLVLSTCVANLPFICPSSGYVRSSSTAWAAAHVAGAAALRWSVNPNRTPHEVQAILEQSADDLGTPGRDNLFGYGRLNAGQAVRQPGHALLLEPSRLYFMVDDSMGVVCRRLLNPTLGAFAWSAKTDADWLRARGPISLPAPSWLEVCVDPTALPGYGTYGSPLVVFNRIDEEVATFIPVKVRYVPRVWRNFLSFVVADRDSLD